MSDRDAMPDDAPGTEVPPQLEERDEKRPAGRPRDAQPDLSDLNDAIAPDSLSGPVRPEGG
jgi:hypothetical protein